MELVDEHMQLDFGGAPQNYWGLPRHPPPGAEGEDADALGGDEAEVDEDDMSPAEVRASSVRGAVSATGADAHAARRGGRGYRCSR